MTGGNAARVLAVAIFVFSIEPQPLTAETARMEDAQRRAAAEDLRRLHERMAAFVAAWNDFIAEYVARGTFNAKKARLVSQTWRDLQREQGWPLPK